MARDRLAAALETASAQAAILLLTALTQDVAQHSDSALPLWVQPSEQVGSFGVILGKLFQLTINSAQQPELTLFDLSLLLRQIVGHGHSAGACVCQLGATWSSG